MFVKKNEILDVSVLDIKYILICIYFLLLCELIYYTIGSYYYILNNDHIYKIPNVNELSYNITNIMYDLDIFSIINTVLFSSSYVFIFIKTTNMLFRKVINKIDPIKTTLCFVYNISHMIIATIMLLTTEKFNYIFLKMVFMPTLPIIYMIFLAYTCYILYK